MIAAFFLALQLLPLPVDEGLLGAFRHGEWDGICWRDGNLSGRSQEECRAWWHRDAPIEVTLERSAETATLTATSAGAIEPCVTSIAFKRHQLNDRARSAAVTTRLRAMIRQHAAKCHVTSTADALVARDLNAVLRETDGLNHLDLF